MTTIAQISDLHVQTPGQLAYGVVDTNVLVANAIAQLNQLTSVLDVIVASGDLVQNGTAAEYEQLKSLLAPLQCPIYLMPGNHDNRGQLQQIFSDHTYLASGATHLSYTVETYAIRMIMLDSIIPGQGQGCIDPERITWLEQQLLAAPDKPTLLFMHHPPFATGIPWMDRKLPQGTDQLAELIRQHPQVKRISCGHLHRTIHCGWAGTVATSQPSLAHQSTLDLAADAPSQFAMEPPAYQLHLWTNNNLISHTVFVGQFEGPFRFADGSKIVAA